MNRLDDIIHRDKISRVRDILFASFIVLAALVAVLAVAHR
jgi:hypothetical protein